MHRVRYRRNRELLMETPPARPDEFAPDSAAVRRVIATALADGKSWLDPAEYGAVLAAYGIPLVSGHLAGGPDQASSVAAAIGFPVALKIRSPDIAYKSDVGGVALNLADANRVRFEAAAMLERVRAARPEARLDGFLVQSMVRRAAGLELLVGLVGDPVFGPAVAFGQGGIAAEIVPDISLELPPLNVSLARRLMARTRVWPLLQGYRGRRAVNVEAIVEVLIGLGQLAADHPEIGRVDVNPFLADAVGINAESSRQYMRCRLRHWHTQQRSK
jgi:acetyltransferase